MNTKTVFATFSDQMDAENTITQLKGNGYNAKDISVLMQDKQVAKQVAEDTGADVAGGAVSGATTGGLIGAMAGLLTGIGAITIPGIGPFIAAGPIATALGLTGTAAATVGGATTGAVAGGLIGALMGLGLSDEDAHTYETSVRDGALLVAVPVRDGDASDVKAIMEDNGADNVRMIDSSQAPRHSAHHAHA